MVFFFLPLEIFPFSFLLIANRDHGVFFLVTIPTHGWFIFLARLFSLGVFFLSFVGLSNKN
jgi:hypothetical protein